MTAIAETNHHAPAAGPTARARTFAPVSMLAHTLGLGTNAAGSWRPTRYTAVTATVRTIEDTRIALGRGRAKRTWGMRARATRGAKGRAVAPVSGMATRHAPSSSARAVVNCPQRPWRVHRR